MISLRFECNFGSKNGFHEGWEASRIRLNATVLRPFFDFGVISLVRPSDFAPPDFRCLSGRFLTVLRGWSSDVEGRDRVRLSCHWNQFFSIMAGPCSRFSAVRRTRGETGVSGKTELKLMRSFRCPDTLRA